MSKGRHTFFGPHWPGPKDVLAASPRDVTAVAGAYQQGVSHREEKGQPVPKARMLEPEADREAGA